MKLFSFCFTSPVPNLKKIVGTLTSSDADIADTLNQQYSSVFTEENTSNIPDIPPKLLSTQQLQSFDISEEDVMKELKLLQPNKSPGVDGIHPRVLRELAEDLAKPVTTLLKRSLEANKI